MNRLKLKLWPLILVLLISEPLSGQQTMDWLTPAAAVNRRSWEEIRLTSIGRFGLPRKARPGIAAHLHTGADIRRPVDNYHHEPIFPIGRGEVISLRDDGPFAQIIIAHEYGNQATVWSVYEHIAGITVSVGDHVSPYNPIARFMNRDELDRYGWQFDHVHLEIMKKKPRPLKPDPGTPYRFFGTYWRECRNTADLEKYYHDPGEFLKSQWRWK
ncbi:MAG: M23 family metallopeptidase [Desulfobacterales bacterium]|nr:M23 family metallopeptidase [Desulfobacterales bacterium]